MDADKAKLLKYYRERNKSLYKMVEKIKLWPSRTGTLHGVRELRKEGDWVVVSTHCGCTLRTRDSKNGRALRQLKQRNYKHACKKCDVPRWKMKKFSD